MKRGLGQVQAWCFVACVFAMVLLAASSAFGYGWSPVSNPATQTISGVSFTSADNGWIVEENGCVFHTVDGGANWTTVTVNSTSPLRGVKFADASHGWITGDGGTVRHTSDGGTTWQSQGMGYNVSLSRPFVLDQLHAWIPAPGGGGMIVGTADGESWAPGEVGGGDSFYGASFSDTLNGWAVGSFGAIRRSIDGGSTWETRTAGTVSEWLYAASTVDSQSAFAVGGSGSALWLYDNGNVWDYEVQTTPAGSLKAVKAFSGGEVFAAGWEAIVHTHDWGQTWEKIYSPSSVELMDLSFPDQYTGFAAGQGGTLLKYTPPAAPVADSLETTDASSVMVTWDASPDAAGYQVRHRSSIATVNNAAATAYSLSLDAPGTTEFAVRAFTSNHLYSEWSTATITNHVAFVEAPAVAANSVVTTSSVQVTWNVIPGAVRYQYRVNSEPAVTTASTTATVGGLSEGLNVVEVRAGTFISWSAWTPRTITYVIQRPQAIALSRIPATATYPTTGVRLYGTTGGHATTVTVESMIAGGSWAPTGITLRSSAAGVIPTATVPIKARTYYRLRFAGDISYAAALSMPVYVAYKPLLKSPAVPKVRRNRTFTTTVSAYTPLKNSGAIVKLRYYRWIRSTHSWKRYKTVTATPGARTASKTAYRAKVRLTRTGTWRVNATYDGKTLYDDATSYRKFTVK